MTDQSEAVPLSSVTTWMSGGTPSRSVPLYWGGNIPWISAATLKHSRISTSNQRLTEEGVRAGSKIAPAGATLVLVRGMALHRETRIGLATRPVSFNQDVKALIPRRGVDPPFLLYSLQSRRTETLELVSSAGNGTGTLNTERLKRLIIWLPDEQVQRKIVAAISNTDDLIATLERLIAKKQAIKRGKMQQFLTGRTRLPGFTETWSATALGDLGLFLKGRAIKRDQVQPSGVPCIRYGELYTAYRDYTETPRSFVTANVAATALPIRSGDLLFAGSGETRDEIGTCVAYVGESEAVAGGDIVVLRGSGFNPIYLGTLLNTPNLANQKARAGQGDAVVHINSRALAEIKINLPPLPEQDAIADMIVDADREIAALRSRLTKTRSIKIGMMQELLTGRTRFPDEKETA